MSAPRAYIRNPSQLIGARCQSLCCSPNLSCHMERTTAHWADAVLSLPKQKHSSTADCSVTPRKQFSWWMHDDYKWQKRVMCETDFSERVPECFTPTCEDKPTWGTTCCSISCMSCFCLYDKEENLIHSLCLIHCKAKSSVGYTLYKRWIKSPGMKSETRLLFF